METQITENLETYVCIRFYIITLPSLFYGFLLCLLISFSEHHLIFSQAYKKITSNRLSISTKKRTVSGSSGVHFKTFTFSVNYSRASSNSTSSTENSLILILSGRYWVTFECLSSSSYIFWLCQGVEWQDT